MTTGGVLDMTPQLLQFGFSVAVAVYLLVFNTRKLTELKEEIYLLSNKIDLLAINETRDLIRSMERTLTIHNVLLERLINNLDREDEMRRKV
jgi:hypothetical protein